jgi:hypothetical protein
VHCPTTPVGPKHQGESQDVGKSRKSPRKSRKLGKHQGNIRKSTGIAPAHFLELLNGTLVDTTALVDQVAGSGGLAGVDVSDDNDVDVSLLLPTHVGGISE